MSLTAPPCARVCAAVSSPPDNLHEKCAQELIIAAGVSTDQSHGLAALFNFAAPLVSPKFYRKIAYVRTLSDLAAVVPMRQILVPPEAVRCVHHLDRAYKEHQLSYSCRRDSRANLTLEQSVTLPSLVAPEVFGRPLSALMPRPNADLPLVISQSTSFLRRSDRLATEGPFRKSPSCGILRALEEAYDRGSPVDLELFRDAHLAAVLIKTLFKRLPAPLFGPEAYPVIRRCPRIKPESERQALDYIQNRIIGCVIACQSGQFTKGLCMNQAARTGG